MIGRPARVALALLAPALVAACSSSTTSTDTTQPPLAPTSTEVPVHVELTLADQPVVLGDSLTVLATLILDDALPDAVIDAAPGRTMVTKGISDTGISRLRELPREPGRPWIIGLGTNDAGYNHLSDAQLSADLYRLLTEIGTGRCLAWVLPYVESPLTEDEIAAVDRFADHVRATLADLPCADVLDWPAVVRATPGLLDPDGVHLTVEGILAYSALIVEQVETWATQAGADTQ